MPRNMSFALTTPQFKARTKTVTRRMGWWFLKPGAVLMGVEKSQGLKKDEKVKRLGLIEVVSVSSERIQEFYSADLVREGFPNMTPFEFVEMFCKANNCVPDAWVNRIEFKYLKAAFTTLGEGE